MTNEDIIRMAQDVGAARLHSTGNIIFGANALEHFVELIAAEEREACARLCKGLAAWHSEIVTAAYENAADAIRARGQE